jgi:signal transduction histidine kinase
MAGAQPESRILIMASKWVDQFFGSGSKSFTQDEIRKSKFGEYFEHLQQNLDRFSEENSIFRIANEILSVDFESNNLELLIGQVLHLIPDFDFEFRRLILKSEEDRMGVFFGSDNSIQELDYLDPQIITLLEKNERIFIHDTSKIHTLKFQPGKVIPKSVLGLSLQSIDGWKCYLWFANSTEVNLTKGQVDGLEMIKAATAKSICRFIKSISIKKEFQIWNSAFNQNPYPCVIFMNNKVAAKNREAEKISHWDEQQAVENLTEMILSAVKQDKTHVEVDGLSFRLNYFLQKEEDENELIFVFLANENQVTIQRNYLNHVMQTISLNFKTPLNNILGFSGMIPLLADVEKPQQDYLDRIAQETKSCLTFTSDLLELSRFSGEKPFVTKEVSIGDLTSNLLEICHHLLRQKRISIEEKIENPEKLVHVDIMLFGQAFYLVLEYMLDQLESGNTISISSGSEEDEFRFQLSDDGKGISDIDVALLNKPEPDSGVDSRIRAAGSIMRLYGGRLAIKSELGKGSEYAFFWPSV